MKKSLLLVLLAINMSLDMKKKIGGGGVSLFQGLKFHFGSERMKPRYKEATMRITSLCQEMQSIALPADKKNCLFMSDMGSMHMPSQMHM